MVNDFRIEKTRLPVVLVTVEGERITGDLFAQASVRNVLGHENAPDVLNSRQQFFPIETMGGQTLLLAKDHVRELYVAREDVEEPAWEMATTAGVEVRMIGGALHYGTLLIEQTSARQRVLDFVNRLHRRFLTVYVDDGVVLLNVSRIAHICPTA